MYQVNRKMMRSMSEDYRKILSSKCALNCLRYQNDFFHSTSSNLNQNYYDILNVPKTASQKEIKSSYLELCKLYHPDTSSDSSLSKEEKVKKFQKINEAYSCLGKPDTKQAYDNSHSNYHPYRNPYTGRTRTYPRRNDGYRPYEDYSYDDSFRNRGFNSFHEQFSKDFEDQFRRPRGRPEFRDFTHGFYKEPSAADKKTVKVFVYVALGMIIYIFALRYYVLMTYQKSRAHRPYQERYYSKIDTSPNTPNSPNSSNNSNSSNSSNTDNKKLNTEDHPNKEFIRYTQRDLGTFRGF